VSWYVCAIHFVRFASWLTERAVGFQALLFAFVQYNRALSAADSARELVERRHMGYVIVFRPFILFVVLTFVSP
jgi:hypothetical protein